METITVLTRKCRVCEKNGELVVPIEPYLRWLQNNGYIQEDLPMLSAGEREQLLTGVHDRCFDLMFPSDGE